MGGVGPLAELLIPALGEAGAGVGAGLTAPSPFQPRKPYTGSLDPESSLSDVQTLLKFLAPGLIDHAQQDVTLPNAVVHNVDPVGGLSLGDVGSLGKPASLPGLKFGSSGMRFDFPSSHGQPTGQSPNSTDPDAGLTDPHTGIDYPGSPGMGASVPPTSTIRRQRFTPDVQSDASDADAADPTSSALALLRHAAQAA